MHTSTKALFAVLALGAVGYGIHKHHVKKQAEESRKRRQEKKQKKAA